MYQIIEAVDAVFATAQFNPEDVIAKGGQRTMKITVEPMDIDAKELLQTPQYVERTKQ